MKSLIYLYKKGLTNRLKQAIKRPVFYFYAVGILFYVIMMASILIGFLLTNSFDSPQVLAIGLSAVILFLGPANFISYAKRKGLIFTPSDVHFVFTSPISPKKVLLFAHAKTMLLSVVMLFFEFFVGVFVFKVSVPTMLLCVFLTCIVDGILQASIVVLLYGNERLSDHAIKLIAKVLFLFVIALAGVVLFIFYKQGFHLSVVLDIFSNPLLQAIPIFGWEVAAIHMLLIGPTTVNMVCTGLFLVVTFVLAFMAYKMRCTGGYYEDAMKFADDYQDARAKSKKGQVAIIGKKQKFKSAKVIYTGGGAKAIFYRQLLEYKKSRYFIFGMSTLIYFAGGILFTYLKYSGEIKNLGQMQYFIIPLVMMYITLLFSGYQTKWEKELESPYTYLIPDSAFKKLWNATAIEHIRSAINGLLFCIPSVIILGIPLWYIPLYTLVNVCVQAIKLYSDTVCETLLGNLLGKTAKTILRAIIMWSAVGVVIPIIMLTSMIATLEISIFIGALYLIALAVGLMSLSSVMFSKMEMQGIPE